MVDQIQLEVEDVEDALKRATELSELTGRTKTDIVADLLDDGQLNYSAGTDTEVKKDLLDVAQEKAEKLKTLLTTLIPVFALLMGIGAEGLGFVDITGWGSESMWEENPNNPDYNAVYWGCMDINAENYDYKATNDDGTCSFWIPPCDTDWQYDDYSSSNENELYVKFLFFDDNNCDVELQGHFIIMLFKDGSSQGIPSHSEDTGIFRNNIEIQSDFIDLEEGTYDYEIEFHTIECDDGNCEHGAEFTSPHKPTFEVQNTDCISNTELDAPLLIANGNDLSVELVFSDLNNCGQDIEIYMGIWRGGQLHDTLDYGEVHSGVIWIEPNGDTTIRVEGMSELANIPDGDEWTVKAKYKHANADNSPFESDWFQSNSIVIDEVQDPIYGCTDSNATNYDSNATENDNSCEYPPEICEINLFDYGFTTNSTHASVYFDLDCGYETNDLSGYNVTVQFLVYELNGTNSGPNATGPIIYEFCTHYIEGWVADVNYLTLTNFTSSNATHYDFYWYAMWTDGNGEGQIIEQKWLNRELEP